MFTFLIALPQSPNISSVSRNETLTVSWTVESTPTQPITQFVGTITVGDRVIEFNTNELTRIYTLEDFEANKIHVIVVCAENVNGRSCSSPYTVAPPMDTVTMDTTTMETTTLTGGTNTPAKVPPGLIAGIAVIVAVLLCCCLLLFLFLLCLCCWKVDRGKSYFPGG